MKKVLATLLVGLFIVTLGFANGLPGIGAKKSSSEVNIEEALSAQSNLVNAYVAGNIYDLESKSLLAEALGFKDYAATLRMASESINDGNVKDIPSIQAKTEEAQKAIDAKMAESSELSEEAKVKVVESLGSLALCIVNYKSAVDYSKPALESATAAVKDASPMKVLSVKQNFDLALFIGPKVPTDFASLVQTATRYIAFAKSAGIEPPLDLEDALGDL